jgi:general secretion pathway protein G
MRISANVASTGYWPPSTGIHHKAIAHRFQQGDNDAQFSIDIEVVKSVVRLFSLVAIVVLVGCADPIESAKEAVKAKAVNKRDLLYQNLQTFPGEVVCGEFESATKWGDSVGFKPFTVIKGSADLAPDEIDLKIFCSEDSASALEARLGIGPLNDSNTSLDKVYKDLSALAGALEAYRKDYGTYPEVIRHPDLQILTRPRRGSTDQNDAYIKAIPADPWGNAYIYQTPRLLRGAKKSYELYTLGKDGAFGGTGEDADIGNQHLKYLDHIKGL